MYKIDFVIPWVDDNDPNWIKQKKKFTKYKNGKSYKKDAFRFRDYDTLKYALRSIEQNCPWFHKIYLITADQVPTWLDTSHPSIELVSHRNLFYNKEHLPTFNSSAIEMNISALSNRLAPYFVYMNDDCIIQQKTNPSRFFQKEKPVDFLSHGWLPRNHIFGLLRGRDSWIHSLNNCLFLINREFFPFNFNNNVLFNRTYPYKTCISNMLLKILYKRFFWLNHWHHPQPYLTETLTAVNQHFHSEMDKCSANKFRDNTDLSAYLYRYWQLASGKFIPCYYNDGHVFQMTSLLKVRKEIQKLKNNNQIRFVCFNDSDRISQDDFPLVKNEICHYLDAIFPTPATFEKTI